MAYSESKKLTDTEKRLQDLKVQLFGKDRKINIVTSNKTSIVNEPATTTVGLRTYQDLAYLKKDLLKILTLAAIAFSIQLIIYLQLTFKIINLN